MPKKQSKEEDAIRIDYIVAWARWKTGENVSKIAISYGKKKSAAYLWFKKVEDLIENRLDPEKLRAAVMLLFPAALESLQYNLVVKKDASVTNNFLNKVILGENLGPKQDDAKTINIQIIQLAAELQRLASTADLARLQDVIKLLGGNGDEAGPSPVLLRKPLPSQSSKPSP